MFGGYLQFDASRRRFLGRTELPAVAQDRHHETLARAYEAGAMLFIASIILLALIVAAVGGGGLILARQSGRYSTYQPLLFCSAPTTPSPR